MATIIAGGVPRDYTWVGNVQIRVTGDRVNITSVEYGENGKKRNVGSSAEVLFLHLMQKGPASPLASEPDTMLRASQVLSQQFDGVKGNVFKVEGDIEPMEYEPGVIY